MAAGAALTLHTAIARAFYFVLVLHYAPLEIWWGIALGLRIKKTFITLVRLVWFSAEKIFPKIFSGKDF